MHERMLGFRVIYKLKWIELNSLDFDDAGLGQGLLHHFICPLFHNCIET